MTYLLVILLGDYFCLFIWLVSLIKIDHFLPTPKQIIIIKHAIFVFIITLFIAKCTTNFKGKNIIQLCAVAIIVLLAYYDIENIEPEPFALFPQSGILPIDNSFDKHPVEYQVKTAIDPLCAPLPITKKISSLGTTNWEQALSNLDYVLSRGVRGLCFNVVYNNNKPFIVSGEYNDEHDFVVDSHNYYPFKDTMQYLEKNAMQNSAKFSISNSDDPLCILIRLHSPETENLTNTIGKTIKSVFKNKYHNNKSATDKLFDMKNKVLFFISNEGIGESLTGSLKDIEYAPVTLLSNKNLQNTLFAGYETNFYLMIPGDAQNKKECSTFEHARCQFIGIHYKKEGEGKETCALKHEKKWANREHAFSLLS